MRRTTAPGAPAREPITAGGRPAGTSELATDVVIRPMRRHDVAGFVALRRDLWVDAVITAESFTWDLDHEPSTNQARRWVATHQGRVVGIAEANRAPWSPAEVALYHVGIDPAWRGRGIGRRLSAEAERHLAGIDTVRAGCRVESGDERSARFAGDRGFRHVRTHRTWSVDPRSVSLADLPSRLAAADAAGLRLAAVRDLLDRPLDLYRMSLALLADMPAVVPATWSYHDWREGELDTPLFSPDASRCVVAADGPVAVTWIVLDAVGGRAAHAITGTLPAYRHRGLATLVKLAAIDWLAHHGVTVLFTENDAENAEMLRINEHLRYRPLTGFEVWLREG